MDCLSHSCPFRVNETSNANRCERVACQNRRNSATDKQRTGDAAPLGYCPFSKHPCGSACALFNAKLRRCGILAALMNR